MRGTRRTKGPLRSFKTYGKYLGSLGGLLRSAAVDAVDSAAGAHGLEGRVGHDSSDRGTRCIVVGTRKVDAVAIELEGQVSRWTGINFSPGRLAGR